MGSLSYGNNGFAVDFEDRALMHLHIVIAGKLRRRESFLFSWRDSADSGSGLQLTIEPPVRPALTIVENLR